MGKISCSLNFLPEQLSIECRKVIALANQKDGNNLGSQSKLEYTWQVRSEGKCARASHDWI